MAHSEAAALPPLPDLSSFDGHTEGPWEARQEFANRWRIEVPREGFIQLSVGLACTTILEVGCSDEDTAANARLIAAAPALIAHVRALQAENERLREVAQALLKAANEVATHGATTGGQWTRLSSAIIQARAALAASRREGE